MSPAEIERLAILAEEMGEAQQVIGKVLRHGWESCHPVTHVSNGDAMVRELGDVLHAIKMMNEDIDYLSIERAAARKRESIAPYLHFIDKDGKAL